MKVPFSTADFLDRAELCYGNRIGVVDEPGGLGSVTYGELARRSRALAAGLDALGVGQGERVAVLSQNSARMLEGFFGVCSSGRIYVPINFRLSQAEVAFIVEHSGSSVVLVDPEVAHLVEGTSAKHVFALGEEYDNGLLREGVEPEPWEPDEDATATINYTSGTTARPKGVQLTHRNCWINATVFGWQRAVNDREFYLHTLPIFHCNGWGMPYAVTGMGGRHIVIRKVDGAEILRRIEEHAVTLLNGAPAVVNAVLDAAAQWQGEIP